MLVGTAGTAGAIGRDTSLVRDAAGHRVISPHYDTSGTHRTVRDRPAIGPPGGLGALRPSGGDGYEVTLRNLGTTPLVLIVVPTAGGGDDSPSPGPGSRPGPGRPGHHPLTGEGEKQQWHGLRPARAAAPTGAAVD